MCTSSRLCTRGIWCMCPTVLLMPSWDPWWHFFGYLLHLRKSCPSEKKIQKDAKTVGFCSPFGTCPGFMPFVQFGLFSSMPWDRRRYLWILALPWGSCGACRFEEAQRTTRIRKEASSDSVRKSSKLLNAPPN